MSFLICSSERAVRKQEGETPKDFLPAAARPAACQQDFALAMPTSTILLGQCLTEGTELAGATGIAGDGDEIGIGLGQFEECGGKFIQVGAAHFQAKLFGLWPWRQGVNKEGAGCRAAIAKR